MFKTIGGIVVIALLFFLVNLPASAEQLNYLKSVQIHQTTHYPDHIEIYSTYQAHIVSTEAFMQSHKDLKLLKQKEGHLYVEKTNPKESPIATLLSILGMKEKEWIKVEKASLFPVGQTPPFIQFEIEAFKA